MSPTPEITHRHVQPESCDTIKSSDEQPQPKTNGHVQERSPLNDLSKLDDDLKNEYYPWKYETVYEPPTFTYKELKECIPSHLFQRSLIKSSVYLTVNLIAVAALYSLATLIDPYIPYPFTIPFWLTYWWLQGVAFTGIWVLAHECGHQGFSDYKTVNDALGFVLHSVLLVPYFAWRTSHAQHHSGTANMERDQVFVPRTRSEYYPEPKTSAWQESIEASPIYNSFRIVRFILFGWPAYLAYHVTGQKFPGRRVSHFHPTSPIFLEKQKWEIVGSDVGVLATVAGLIYWCHLTSPLTVLKLYGIPYLLVNGWLVTITLLQHTDVYLPHYSPREWNFVRGSLSTVDRDYGSFLNHALHHIHDSHVVHHLFSTMPFYNAIKATPYIKSKLGEYYFFDQTPWWKALWRIMKRCRFVEDAGDILFYR